MPSKFRKRLIPPGARFTAKVTRTSSSGRFDASGCFQPPGGDQTWTHQQLTTGSFVARTLSANRFTYEGDVSVVFDTQSTVQIELEVRKRDANGDWVRHGETKFDESFSGQNGKLVRVYFSLATR